MYLCDAIWRIYRPIWNAVADNAIETRGPWYAINRSRELKRCTRSTGTKPYISWKLLIIPLLQSGQVGRARCTCADSFHPLPKRGNATRTVVSYSTFLRRINSSRYINLQMSYSWVFCLWPNYWHCWHDDFYYFRNISSKIILYNWRWYCIWKINWKYTYKSFKNTLY